MVNRKKYNLLIVWKLMTIIVKHPNLRFCQILSILELDKDNFYEEPDKTWKKVLENRTFNK